ncbi:hypothetical protein [Agromyces sp. H66]|uniref:hypothetical protein n=1 Tax=Agromyces sp. H66 TaxID=2529859 RepID=UPI0010A9D87D|nr:hypothetical protein [Agromyces sp. H66]
MDLDALPRGPGDVFPSARARSIGVSASLLTARDAGELVVVRRGVYVPTGFDELPAVEQHRTRAFAVAHQRPGVVFAGFTAAVLQGMPVVGGVPREVVVLATKKSGRRRNGVVEIVRRVGTHVMTADGVTTTSRIDTLLEVARTRPLLTALAIVDAELYRPRFGEAGAKCTLEELRQAFAAMLPFPGSRRVAAVLDRATHLAETPLETLSRVRIDELGFPQPELQRSVQRPRSGSLAFLDFAWPEHGVWGEADGDGKYLGNARRNGDLRSAAEIVRDEKARENEVRAATRWACARWEWADAWKSGPLRDILLEAGLPRLR